MANEGDDREEDEQDEQDEDVDHEEEDEEGPKLHHDDDDDDEDEQKLAKHPIADQGKLHDEAQRTALPDQDDEEDQADDLPLAKDEDVRGDVEDEPKEIPHESKNESEEDSENDADKEGEIKTLENGGIIKKILKKGSGWETPEKGAEVIVHYVGTLLEDGSEFDSSRGRNEPFKFKIGEGSVIKGWDIGVATMKLGEKALLTCKPEYAYGANGSGSKIPPNATLNFEIELISWTTLEKVTDDGGVMKKVLQKGEQWKTPKQLGTVTVTYKGTVKGEDRPFVEEKEKELALADLSLPWGLVEGLEKMKKGEKQLLFVSPEYGYGVDGNKDLNIGPNASLEYEITLIDFHNPKDNYDMSKPEKVDHGAKLKDFGNGVYKLRQYGRAKKIYDEVVRLFEHEKDLTGEDRVRVEKLKLDCNWNKAACLFEEKDYAGTVKACSEVLALDSHHTRALFKRARAHAHSGDNDLANRDLKTLGDIIRTKEEAKQPLQVDPKAVATFAASVKQRIIAAEKKQRKIFGGMFNKVSLVSDEEVRKAKEAPKPAVDSEDEKSEEEEKKEEEEEKKEDEPKGEDDAEKAAEAVAEAEKAAEAAAEAERKAEAEKAAAAEAERKAEAAAEAERAVAAAAVAAAEAEAAKKLETQGKKGKKGQGSKKDQKVDSKKDQKKGGGKKGNEKADTAAAAAAAAAKKAEEEAEAEAAAKKAEEEAEEAAKQAEQEAEAAKQAEEEAEAVAKKAAAEKKREEAKAKREEAAKQTPPKKGGAAPAPAPAPAPGSGRKEKEKEKEKAPQPKQATGTPGSSAKQATGTPASAKQATGTPGSGKGGKKKK